MINRVIRHVLIIAFAFSLSACYELLAGIGGSGAIPIGGSGVASVGSPAAIGQITEITVNDITVNGVKFSLDGSSIIEIDDNLATINDLAIGMVVRVGGSVNNDDITGNATTVTFKDDLEGPIDGTITENIPTLTKTFTVLGHAIEVDNAKTTFVGGAMFGYATLTSGDNIQISGFVDEAGVMRATHIELKGVYTSNATIVEIKGTISNLAGNMFTINTVNSTSVIGVDASSATLTLIPAGLTLANGLYVEVKGTTINTSAATIDATEVGLEVNNIGGQGNVVKLEGIITRYVSDSDFDVDGQKVDANVLNATLIPGTLTLATGMSVIVEGIVNTGTLRARIIIQQ